MNIFTKYLFYGMTDKLPIISSAIGQQSIVIGSSYLFDGMFQVYYCIVMFSIVFHLPNVKLMILTFIFGLLFYSIILYPAFLPIIPIAHAAFGTVIYKLGLDMRVWRFK